MTRKELFDKYSINESHSTWDNAADNWFSVDIYRVMHDNNLPDPVDLSLKYIVDFLDKTKDASYFFSLPNNGSLYLTAKRLVYRHAEALLEELNQ